MRPLVAVAALSLLAPPACVHERLVWRFPDGSCDPRRLAEDVDACEEYTAIVDDDAGFPSSLAARSHGGWGSFPLEFCMNGRGWVLTRVPTARDEGR